MGAGWGKGPMFAIKALLAQLDFFFSFLKNTLMLKDVFLKGAELNSLLELLLELCRAYECSFSQRLEFPNLKVIRNFLTSECYAIYSTSQQFQF